MRLLDNPTTFTKEGVERALDIRHIANDQGMSDMVMITAMIWIVTAVIIAVPWARKNRAIAIPLFLFVCTASIPMFISFAEIDFSMQKPSITSMMQIFHLCDGIIIMFGYAYGVSYEAANLIVFAVIQPVIIIYLTIMSLLNHGNKLRKGHLG